MNPNQKLLNPETGEEVEGTFKVGNKFFRLIVKKNFIYEIPRHEHMVVLQEYEAGDEKFNPSWSDYNPLAYFAEEGDANEMLKSYKLLGIKHLVERSEANWSEIRQ